MTVSELIAQLQKLPPNAPMCACTGQHLGNHRFDDIRDYPVVDVTEGPIVDNVQTYAVWFIHE
jgi:hypothetical protein